jgi:hypothetical protein
MGTTASKSKPLKSKDEIVAYMEQRKNTGFFVGFLTDNEVIALSKYRKDKVVPDEVLTALELTKDTVGSWYEFMTTTVLPNADVMMVDCTQHEAKYSVLLSSFSPQSERCAYEPYKPTGNQVRVFGTALSLPMCYRLKQNGIFAIRSRKIDAAPASTTSKQL